MKIIITTDEIRAKFNLPSSMEIEVKGLKKSNKGRKKGATKANGYRVQ